MLTREDFKYDLPQSQIAQEPLPRRDQSKLLVWETNNKTIEDSKFYNVIEHLEEKSIIIRNNSRVIPSRLFSTTVNGGKVECMLISPVVNSRSSCWKVFAKPLKKLKVGSILDFGNVVGKVKQIFRDTSSPYCTIDFDMNWDEFYVWLEQYGNLPLPPYITRDYTNNSHAQQDKLRYQTVYSKPKGSVAAPTAGLHFTDELIQKLTSEKDITFLDVTLHVGAGTFLPVKTSSLNSHKMHEEKYFVSEEVLRKIFDYKSKGYKVYSVGTTTFRCLESLAIKISNNEEPQEICNKWHETDLFIYPKNTTDRYQPYFFDGILTNFHQPESTLLMLISCLVGYDNMKAIYSHALQQNYRFLSYGDSSLLKF